MKCVFIFVWVLPCTHTHTHAHIHTHAHTQSWCILRIIVVVVLFWRGIRNHFQTFFVFIGRCDSQGILFGGLRNTHKGKAPLIYSMYRIFMCLVPANIVKQTPLHQQPSVARWGGHFSLLYPNHFCTLFTKYQIIVSTFYGCLKKMRSTVGWSRRGYRIYVFIRLNISF